MEGAGCQREGLVNVMLQHTLQPPWLPTHGATEEQLSGVRQESSAGRQAVIIA